MNQQKSIIPEFMIDNPNDTFKFLFPLRLKLDHSNYANSHFEVIVKNMSKDKGEVFLYDISPELLYTHYPIEKSFNNGEPNHYYINKNIFNENFIINTSLLSDNNTLCIKDILDEDTIGTLIGWKRTFLSKAKYIKCYLIEANGIKIIIPHSAVAIYYYYRFTHLREAVLVSNLEKLYIACNCDRDNASIVLTHPRNDADAAFIHRYACQDIAKKAFDDISQYIQWYIKYVYEKNPNDEVESTPIKAKFPTKEEFQINTRASIVHNKITGEKFYYVYEIINDYSDIGFDGKLEKIYEKTTVISEPEDLTKMAKVEREIPLETTEALKIEHANKRYTQTQNNKDKKQTCGSMENIIVESKAVTKNMILDTLKIYKETLGDEAVDQSLTESVSGTKTIRKTIISSEYEKEEKSKSPQKEIDNFVVFRQYIDFLQKQTNLISNFQVSKPLELSEVMKDDDTINPKCKIKGRNRQYLTVTFKRKNLYVGLLELENYTSSAVSTWLLVSSSAISANDFQKFIDLYIKDDFSIHQIKEMYKNGNIKFTTKNHERNENLNNVQLVKWVGGLLGKTN
jgi:hypothetical protein